MPWRVGQAVRHLHHVQRLALHHALHFPASWTVGHPHHSIRVRWPSATVAPTRRHHSAKTSNASRTPIHARGAGAANRRADVSRPQVAPQQREPARGEVQAQLPAPLPIQEFALLIDAAFFRAQEKESPVERLKQNPQARDLLGFLGDREKARILALNMATTRHPLRALRVLSVARQLGCAFKQNAYESLAHQLGQHEHWYLLPSLIKLGRRDTSRTTLRLLNWYARALIEVKQFKELEDVPLIFKEEGLRPDRRTYHLLISGFLRNRDVVKARHFLTEMQAAGFTVDSTTHALIASVYRALGPDKTVRSRALQALPGADERTKTVILNSLILMALEMRDIQGALQYLSLFKGGPPGSGESPDDGEDPAPDAGNSAPLDATTFTMFLNYFARDGNVERAMQVIQWMQDLNVAVDDGVAAALVRVYHAAGQTSTAIALVANMCDESAIPLADLYHMGLEPGTPSPALVPRWLPVKTPVLNALLDVVLETRGINVGYLVLKIFRGLQLWPDEYTLEIFLRHLVAARIRPREVLRFMSRLYSPRLPPSLRHLHVLMKALIFEERQWLRNRGPTATVASVSDRYPAPKLRYMFAGSAQAVDTTAGLEIPLRLSYRALVRPMLRALLAHGIRSDRATWAQRILHDGVIKGDMRMARASFDEMIGRGLHPNTYHYAALMEGYARNGLIAEAAAVLEEAAQAGIKPNVYMHTVIIVGYSRLGQPRQALNAFEKMYDSGVDPDIPAIHSVVWGYAAAGELTIASRMLVEVWPIIGPFPKSLHGEPFEKMLQTFENLTTGSKKYQPISDPAVRFAMRSTLRWIIRMWKQLDAECGKVPEKMELEEQEL